jgi:hypothetical protein
MNREETQHTEEGRLVAEGHRQDAEQARENAEDQRHMGEEMRKSAEAMRQEAEQQRETERERGADDSKALAHRLDRLEERMAQFESHILTGIDQLLRVLHTLSFKATTDMQRTRARDAAATAQQMMHIAKEMQQEVSERSKKRFEE